MQNRTNSSTFSFLWRIGFFGEIMCWKKQIFTLLLVESGTSLISMQHLRPGGKSINLFFLPDYPRGGRESIPFRYKRDHMIKSWRVLFRWKHWWGGLPLDKASKVNLPRVVAGTSRVTGKRTTMEWWLTFNFTVAKGLRFFLLLIFEWYRVYYSSTQWPTFQFLSYC